MAPRSFSLLLSVLTLLLGLTLATAQDDGMDTSMNNTMAPNNMQGMITNLHFRPFGDTLWFSGWMPESPGAMVGACVGLFFLALVERCLAGVRGMAERAWRARAQALAASRNRGQTMKGDDEKQEISSVSVDDVVPLRTIAPFIPSQNITRGALYALQAALGYALMLAVMTYQAAFIIAIVVGLGVGEALFGRFIVAGAGTRVD